MGNKEIQPGLKNQDVLKLVGSEGLRNTSGGLAGGLSFSVSEHPVFTEVRFSIKPTEGADGLAQLKSCLKNLDEGISKMGLSKDMICQQSTYSNENPNELSKNIRGHYIGSPPTTSHVGELPLGENLRVSTEHMILIPKGKDIRIRREPVSLEQGMPFEKIIIETDEARITKTGVEHEKYGVGRYTVVEGKKDGFKRVYAAGLTGGRDDISESSNGAFELQKLILEKEGMVLTDIMCQRNFIEDIDGENYHTFNGIRREFWGNSFKPGHLHKDWPAATGIGQDQNAVVIKFIAEKSRRIRVCVDNPAQTRSDSYSNQFQSQQAVTEKTGRIIGEPIDVKGVGMNVNRPAFSRALILANPEQETVSENDVIGEVFISGTASITGKKGGGKDIPYAPEGFKPTYVDVGEIERIMGKQGLINTGLEVHEDGGRIFASSAVEAQTLDTINNISRLVSRKNLENHGVQGRFSFDDLKRLRIYVKNSEDGEKVDRICSAIFGKTPSTTTKADVCYADLLVEIGGVGQIRKEK